MNKTKLLGQTFTEFKEIKEMCNLFKGDWLNSKILEPSFGNGQFLIYIIEKIIKKCKRKKMSDNSIKKILENNIYGYEIDLNFRNIAIQNINAKLKDLKFSLDINWKNLECGSIFLMKEKDFDFIIGNPPYVRVQNFDEGIHKIKKTLDRTSGNTDLYLMFIDYLLSKLSNQGEFIFIVPNSFGKSKAGKKIRDYMYKNGFIHYIDFESRQLFSKVSVYSCIFHFILNSKKKSIFQIDYSKEIYKLTNINYFDISEKNILNFNVKNGIATLCDRVFIKTKKPNIEEQFIKKIYKGSKMNETYYAIFPYLTKNNKIIRLQEKQLQNKWPKLFNYLLENKERLLKRSLDKNAKWYEYGRSQAINDIFYEKYLINTLIKPKQKELEIKKISKNTLVFSGLYSVDEKIIKENNEKIIKILRFKAKDMRGGYKKISSSLLKKHDIK